MKIKHFSKLNTKKFSITNRIKNLFKGNQEKIERKKNLQESLNIFKETDQFISDQQKEKIEKNIEFAMSTSYIQEKYINYQPRKTIDVEPLDDEQIKLLNQLIEKIDMTKSENQIKDLNRSSNLTLWEKLDYYEINSEGKVINPHILKIDSSKRGNKNLVFNTVEQYTEYKENVKNSIKNEIKQNLTPMEYYITQGKNTERAFTGYYADFYEHGIYSCKTCTQNLFSSTHKYQTDSGWASFWNFLPFSISFKNDNIEKYKTPTQAILPIKFVGNKPITRLACSHVSIY